MKTTLQIPLGLLDDAMRSGGYKTKTATVVHALEALVRNAKREKLQSLRGAMPDFSLDLDALRSRQ